MGRMADARKRARQAGAGAPPGPEPPPPVMADLSSGAGTDVPAVEPVAAAAAIVDTVRAAIPPPEPPPPAELTFLDAPPSAPVEAGTTALGPRGPASGRFVLPASGLAEEILARAETGDLSAPGAASEPPSPPPAEQAARVHNISFFTAPLHEQREAVEATEHLVTFLLASEEYGVDVRLVQEIIRVSPVTPVPRAPGFIKGVINLRGRIIPVVDLKDKLSLGQVDQEHRRARIVVVRLRGRLIGLLVDGASQVLKVPVSLIEPAPEEVVPVEANFLRGVAKMTKRLIILLDLQEVLAPELRAAGAAPSDGTRREP